MMSTRHWDACAQVNLSSRSEKAFRVFELLNSNCRLRHWRWQVWIHGKLGRCKFMQPTLWIALDQCRHIRWYKAKTLFDPAVCPSEKRREEPSVTCRYGAPQTLRWMRVINGPHLRWISVSASILHAREVLLSTKTVAHRTSYHQLINWLHEAVWLPLDKPRLFLLHIGTLKGSRLCVSSRICIIHQYLATCASQYLPSLFVTRSSQNVMKSEHESGVLTGLSHVSNGTLVK